MKAKSWNSFVVIGLLSAVTFTSLAVGQNRTFQEKIEQMSGDNIPEAVLRTEKGQYFAQRQRLRILRRQEESMGSKHPGLKNVQDQIAEVKQQLDAWTSEAVRKYVQSGEGERAQPIVAVDNVCAWPNLTVLPDGTVMATIHNQPSHLKVPADVECWASEDGGRTWANRGTPARRDNECVARGNVAAGVASNGDLIVIASGWSDPASKTRGTILPPIVSRSADGGRTWTVDAKAFPDKWPEVARTNASPNGYVLPFGDILEGADGTLRVGFYGGAFGAGFVYRSRDDGKTWGAPVTLNKYVVIHEPALFHLGEGKWLAAARLNGLDLYASDDDAKTWAHRQKLTGPQQHPGHITRLKDRRLLLSYGNRLGPKGVDVRFSDDEGTTWSEPFRVVDFQGDGGYPSTVQIPNGQVLTAYYARGIAGHNRYHMGVVVWDPATLRGR